MWDPVSSCGASGVSSPSSLRWAPDLRLYWGQVRGFNRFVERTRLRSIGANVAQTFACKRDNQEEDKSIHAPRVPGRPGGGVHFRGGGCLATEGDVIWIIRALDAQIVRALDLEGIA